MNKEITDTFFLSIDEEVKHLGGYTTENKMNILDSITPIVKSMMDSLSPIEKAFIHALIMRDRLIRKGLAKNILSEFLTMNLLSIEMGEPSRVLSVYAKRFCDAGLIERKPINAKDFAYGFTHQVVWDWFHMRYGKNKPHRAKENEGFVTVSPEIVFKCKTVAEHRLYEQMSAMHQSGKIEMPLSPEDYTSEGEKDEETGKVYEKEVVPEDITTKYLNKAIANVGKHGFGQAGNFRVVEKNIGELYLQYVQN